ncbi:hypothetical protein HQ584_04840 [Patescibacteria group bacterium]|nr:hypothetical protein [Patescibacteria group bacterium]
MTTMREVLSRIGKRNTINNLAEELNMRKSTLRAMIEFMVNRGYLGEIGAHHSCFSCLLNPKCSAKYDGLKIYTLTSRGMEYIKREELRGLKSGKQAELEKDVEKCKKYGFRPVEHKLGIGGYRKEGQSKVKD